LHKHSLTIAGTRVDVPLRAFSPHYYPNLVQLYQHLSLPTQAVDYSSCTSSVSPNEPLFRYRNILIFGRAVPYLPVNDLISRKGLAKALAIVRDVLWMVFSGPHLLTSPKHKQRLAQETFSDFLRRQRFSEPFIYEFLYPILSTILSCTYRQVGDYPAIFILEFFCSRSTAILTGWYRVTRGVEEVSELLLKGFDTATLKLGVAVEYVRWDAVRQKVEVRDARGGRYYFDDVVMATDATVARALWRDPPAAVDRFLSLVPTHTADITVHTDESFLPCVHSERRGMNVFCRKGATGATGPSDDASMTTALLSTYHPGLEGHARQLLETWNPLRPVAEGHTIRTITMTRASWNMSSLAAYDAMVADEALSSQHIHLAGAYSVPGLTLLEQAVVSGLRCAMQLGASPPFPVKERFETSLVLRLMGSAIVHWKELTAVSCLLVAMAACHGRRQRHTFDLSTFS
jgi:predicted NAD/FAD-binding protein